MSDLSPAWTAWVDAIKARMPDALHTYVKNESTKFKRFGKEYRSTSPHRHNKNSQNFYLYADGAWFDHGCDEGGDAIAYVQKRDGGSYREALDTLAKDLGLPSWEEARGPKKQIEDAAELMALWEGEGKRRRVREVVTALVRHCHATMPDTIRAFIRTKYGLSDAFIDAEQIGWVPGALFEEIREIYPDDYTEKDLLRTGLFIRHARGVHTHYAHRILFPYWLDGYVEYSIGRKHFESVPKEPAWDDLDPVEEDPHDIAKYKKQLVRRDDRAYVSSTIANDTFWGEDCLRHASRETSLLFIEGVTDAMMAKQLGFHTISPVTNNLKSGMTDKTALLAKQWKEVVILNDNEVTKRGTKGAVRTATMLWESGERRIRIGTLPLPTPETAKIDVNEFGVWKLKEARERGLGEDEAIESARGELQKVVDEAVPFLDFVLREIPQGLSAVDFGEHLETLGKLAQRLTELERVDLWKKVLDRFPKMAKKASKKAFEDAVAEEGKRQKKEAKEAKEVEVAPSTPTAEIPYEGAPLRGAVMELELGAYSSQTEDGTERVSTFSLLLIRTITVDEGPDLLVCKVIGRGGKPLTSEWAVPQVAWHNKRAFIGAFPTNQMQWTGDDNGVQSIYEILTRNGTDHVPNVKSTRCLGYHELSGGRKRFLLPSGVLDETGTWMEEPDLSYVPVGGKRGSNIQDRLPTDNERVDILSENVRSIAKEALETLLLLQAPEIILPCASWFAAAAFKPRFLKTLTNFTILNIFGTQGSGKTSIVSQVLWPLFGGVKNGEPLSCTATNFTFAKDMDSTNGIPLPYDEYKPVDMGKYADVFRRYCRRVYAGESEPRGHQDQSLSIYHLVAPILVIGEHKFDEEPALRERATFASPDKTWLSTNLVAQDRYSTLREKDLWRVGPLYQGWTLTVDFATMLERAKTDTLAIFKSLHVPPTISPRIKNNVIEIVFGTLALHGFASHVGAVLPKIDLAYAVAKLLGETFDTTDLSHFGSSVRDSVDDLVADASDMANQGVLRENDDYSKLEGKIFLYMKGIEDKRSEWRAKQHRSFSSPGYRALRAIVREKMKTVGSYIVEAAHRAWMGDDKFVHGILIDPAKIPTSYGIDPFPCKDDRTHGGDRVGWTGPARRAGFGGGPEGGSN